MVVHALETFRDQLQDVKEQLNVMRQSVKDRELDAPMQELLRKQADMIISIQNLNLNYRIVKDQIALTLLFLERPPRNSQRIVSGSLQPSFQLSDGIKVLLRVMLHKETKEGRLTAAYQIIAVISYFHSSLQKTLE